MKTVKVLHKKPDEIMTIVREFRNQGYQQGVDFDFAYFQPSYDNDSVVNECVEPRHTIFKFYQDKLATFFILKYGT